jgi:hypothetical protein
MLLILKSFLLLAQAKGSFSFDNAEHTVFTEDYGLDLSRHPEGIALTACAGHKNR